MVTRTCRCGRYCMLSFDPQAGVNKEDAVLRLCDRFAYNRASGLQWFVRLRAVEKRIPSHCRWWLTKLKEQFWSIHQECRLRSAQREVHSRADSALLNPSPCYVGVLLHIR